jgi:hypothetical protein
MFLQCRNAATMKVLQRPAQDSDSHIAPVAMMTSEQTKTNKEGGTAHPRAVPPSP